MISISFKRRVLIEKFRNKVTRRFEIELFLQRLLESCRIYSIKRKDEETFFFIDDKEGLETFNKFVVVLEIQCKKEISAIVIVNEFGLYPLFHPYSSDWVMIDEIRHSLQSLFPNIISENHIRYIKINRTSDISYVFAKSTRLK